MRAAPWIARLKAELAGLQVDVRGAAALAAARSDHRRDAVYVAPLSDTAAPSRVIGAMRQTVAARMGIVIAVDNSRDPRGEQAVSELERIREAVRDALLGWRGADGAWTPAEYRGGRLLRFEERTIWWQDEYEAQELIQELISEEGDES